MIEIELGGLWQDTKPRGQNKAKLNRLKFDKKTGWIGINNQSIIEEGKNMELKIDYSGIEAICKTTEDISEMLKGTNIPKDIRQEIREETSSEKMSTTKLEELRDELFTSFTTSFITLASRGNIAEMSNNPLEIIRPKIVKAITLRDFIGISTLCSKDEVIEKAKEFLAKGFRSEVERLTTNQNLTRRDFSTLVNLRSLMIPEDNGNINLTIDRIGKIIITHFKKSTPPVEIFNAKTKPPVKPAIDQKIMKSREVNMTEEERAHLDEITKKVLHAANQMTDEGHRKYDKYEIARQVGGVSVEQVTKILKKLKGAGLKPINSNNKGLSKRVEDLVKQGFKTGEIIAGLPNDNPDSIRSAVAAIKRKSRLDLS
ncbi:MAG: hypothetical protein Q8P80_02410 [Candidatus Levybacteria bacterium]|nr:hypothetical protein [Candidatus Levybacteria bacterium]